MNLFEILKNILLSVKKLEKSSLPSQGLFYNDDFLIKIRKANNDDIKLYESDFKKEDLVVIITKVKEIVEKNIILPKKYTFDDLKSIDVVFIFLEIVKFTKKREIIINYVDELKNKVEQISFDSKTFNYYNIENYKKYYNNNTKSFDIKGYSFTLPSIGVENCITYYLMKNSDSDREFEDINFNFSYFLAQKNFLTFDEVENLIEIFNFDMEDEERIKIEEIIASFIPLQKYSLIKNGREIDINSKIDLENIWK
jgi:hypothetical protein